MVLFEALALVCTMVCGIGVLSSLTDNDCEDLILFTLFLVVSASVLAGLEWSQWPTGILRTVWIGLWS